jgi:hemerythrin-like domain-containing protein
MPCDPFQMTVIHRALRAEFGNLPALIRAVTPGDTGRSTFVGKYLDNMIAVLHHHHAAEDEVLWPKLHQRTPSSDNEVRRAEDAHAGIAALVDEVQSVRSSWAGSADSRLGVQLGSAVDGLSSRLNEHLDDEEQHVVALIGQYVTPPEWQSFIDRGAAYVGPSNVWFALAFAGVLLGGATADEQQRFFASLPFALRMVLKLLGPSAYATYQTKLYGAPA